MLRAEPSINQPATIDSINPPAEIEADKPGAIIIPLSVLSVNETVVAATIETEDQQTAVDAFKQLLSATVIEGLTKEYHPGMNPLQAIVDNFYHAGKFSWQSTAIFAGALTIGGLASVFTVKPSGEAAHLLVQYIKALTGYSLPATDVLVVIFKSVNTGEVALVATLSGMKMLQTYINRPIEPVRFLTYSKATKLEICGKISRKLFDLLSAAAANVPTFLLTWAAAGIPLALFSALANMALSWQGISVMPLTPSRVPAACRVEADYLQDMLETFFRLTLIEQITILDRLKDIAHSGKDDVTFKKFYAALLNMAKPAPQSSDDVVKTQIQSRKSISYKEEIAAKGLGLGLLPGQLVWVETAGVGTANIFPDPTSPQAITTGIVMALLSLLPGIGFGYSAGSHLGRRWMSDKEVLANLHRPRIRLALKWLIKFLSTASGATMFTIADGTATRFLNLVGAQGILKNVLKLSFDSFIYTNAATTLAYYTLLLLDELLVYFARRCGNEEVQRLYEFAIQVRYLQSVLPRVSNENDSTLREWKVSMSANDSYDGLSKLMYSIYHDRLTDKEYLAVQKELREKNIDMPDRDKLTDQYTARKFLNAYTESQLRQHPGLRKRCHGLFDHCAKPATDVEQALPAPASQPIRK